MELLRRAAAAALPASINLPNPLFADPRIQLHYGSESRPTALAYDSVQSILAVGYHNGSLNVFGTSGLQLELPPTDNLPISSLTVKLGTSFIVASSTSASAVLVWNLVDRSANIIPPPDTSLRVTTIEAPPSSTPPNRPCCILVGFNNGSVSVLDLVTSTWSSDSIPYCGVPVEVSGEASQQPQAAPLRGNALKKDVVVAAVGKVLGGMGIKKSMNVLKVNADRRQDEHVPPPKEFEMFSPPGSPSPSVPSTPKAPPSPTRATDPALPRRMSTSVTSLALHPLDSNIVSIGYASGTLILWELKQRRVAHRIDFTANTVGCWTPDGMWMLNTGASLLLFEVSSSVSLSRHVWAKKSEHILLEGCDPARGNTDDINTMLHCVESAIGSSETLAADDKYWIVVAGCLDGKLRIIKASRGLKSLALCPLPPTSRILAVAALPPLLTKTQPESMSNAAPCLVTLTETGHLHAYSLESGVRKLFLPPPLRMSKVCGMATSMISADTRKELSALQVMTDLTTLPLTGGALISSPIKSKTVLALADNLSQIHLLLVSSPIPIYICQFDLRQMLPPGHYVNRVTIDLEHESKNMIVTAGRDVLMLTYIPSVKEEDLDEMMAMLDETVDGALRESPQLSEYMRQQDSTSNVFINQDLGAHGGESHAGASTPIDKSDINTTSPTSSLLRSPSERQPEPTVANSDRTSVMMESIPPSAATEVQSGWFCTYKSRHQEDVVALDYAYWLNMLATCTESGMLALVDIRQDNSCLYYEVVYDSHETASASSVSIIQFTESYFPHDQETRSCLLVFTTHGALWIYRLNRHEDTVAIDKLLLLPAMNAPPVFVNVLNSNGQVLTTPSSANYVIAVTSSSIHVVELRPNAPALNSIQVKLDKHVIATAGLSYFQNFPCLVCITVGGWALVYRLPDAGLEFERDMGCPGMFERALVLPDGRIALQTADRQMAVIAFSAEAAREPKPDIRVFDSLKQHYWANLQREAGSLSTRELDELFEGRRSHTANTSGQSSSAPASRTSMSSSGAFGAAQEALALRGEKLSKMSVKTNQLENSAADFLANIQAYNKKQVSKKWYQL
ncbi:hypothetical protein SeLEV6574_g04006 [Synchytrium endobioticum]|uniref:V-SNARE coiled-coil homology domain-containing protein n=1 Tax=Synchytrium endobioticum TaxID=286115 RepID=A0A507D1B5_9FUNG|nr:hypothetical protein SeLEV6574_g04006 [Synchytrium endobioticum]